MVRRIAARWLDRAQLARWLVLPTRAIPFRRCMATLQPASHEGRRGSLDVLWPDGVPVRLRQAFDEAMAADASEEVDLRDIGSDFFSRQLRMIMLVGVVMMMFATTMQLVEGSVWQDHWRLFVLALTVIVMLGSVCALFGIRPMETSAAVCSPEGLTTSSIFGTRTFRPRADHVAVFVFTGDGPPEMCCALIVLRSANGRISSGGTVSDHGAADPAAPSPEPSESRDHA